MMFWVLFTTVGASQGNLQYGVIPSLNLNHSLQNEWRINLKLETREQFFRSRFSEEENAGYDHILTDLTTVVSKKTRYNHTVAGGILFRFRNGEFIPRTLQQFVLTRKYEFFRLSHRFRFDQTYLSESPDVFRLRYRLSTQFPLSGQEVDARETYLKFNQEFVNQFAHSDYDLEYRIVPSLGIQFSDTSKFEIGVDYRIRRFLDGLPVHSIWGTVSWFVIW